MDGTAGRVRRARRSRGETLVETVVAFAVLTILLTMVTTIVKGGVALNNRAVKQMERLNIDCISVETGSGLAGPRPETLTLTCAGGTGVDANDAGRYRCEIYIDGYGGELISIFQTMEVTGG